MFDTDGFNGSIWRGPNGRLYTARRDGDQIMLDYHGGTVVTWREEPWTHAGSLVVKGYTRAGEYD